MNRASAAPRLALTGGSRPPLQGPRGGISTDDGSEQRVRRSGPLAGNRISGEGRDRVVADNALTPRHCPRLSGDVEAVAASDDVGRSSLPGGGPRSPGGGGAGLWPFRGAIGSRPRRAGFSPGPVARRATARRPGAARWHEPSVAGGPARGRGDLVLALAASGRRNVGGVVRPPSKFVLRGDRVPPADARRPPALAGLLPCGRINSTGPPPVDPVSRPPPSSPLLGDPPGIARLSPAAFGARRSVGGRLREEHGPPPAGP